VPVWLLPKDDCDGFTEHDGSFTEKETLRNTFLSEISQLPGGDEWLEAYEMGRDFRKFMYRLDCPGITWRQKGFARWVQDRFDWARLYPGAPCTNSNEYNFEV
jgi:hypothetical protein